MASITDPAFELGEIAERLRRSANSAGDAFLAEQFGVQAWTTAFIRIIGCIYERIDLVEEIVQRPEVDEGVRDTALQVIIRFRAGFNGDSLRQGWNISGYGLAVMAESATPLRLLSSIVRPYISYPKLSDEEITEFILLIDEYLVEIRDNHDEPAFVRQAIIDGLTKFQFQLKYVGWMGSGYILNALRDVMVIYDLAARHAAPQEMDANAILNGLGRMLKRMKETVDTAKSWSDSGTAVFETYKLAASLAAPVLLLTQRGA